MSDTYKNNYQLVEKEDLNENEINFQDFLKVLLRRKKIVICTSLLVFTIALIYTAYKRIYKPIYSGNFSVLISNPIDSAYKDSGKIKDSNLAAITSIADNSNTFKSEIPTLIAYLESPVTLKDLAKKLGKSPKEISKMINIEEKGSKIGALNVKIRTDDPKFGNIFVKELSSFYLSIANLERLKSLGDGLSFLKKQEPELRKRNFEIEEKIAKFREKYTFLAPEMEGVSLKDQEAVIKNQLIALETEKNNLLNLKKEILKGNLSATIYEEVIKKGTVNGINLVTRDSDRSLLDLFFEVEKKLSLAKTNFTDTSKTVTRLQGKLDYLKPKALNKQIKIIDTALELNSAKYKEQINQRNKIQENFRKQPNLVKEYNVLTQNLLISKENLTSLLLAKENFQLKIAQNKVPWRLLSEPSMSNTPVEPNISTSIFYALILSSFSGIAIGFIRDRFDYVLRSPQDLNKEMQLPLLGNIPYVTAFKGIREKRSTIIDTIDTPPKKQSDANESKVFNSERFFYQESFRNLYTSLRFLDGDKPIKSFCFSSSSPSEGKSLISIIFAKTLAELGKKVLLIDADMRKPQIHLRLGINNISGLSNIISSENLNWRKKIQDVKSYPTWKVISSGVRPPDTTRLISTKKMRDLIKDIENSNEFDFIIYDTPPIIGLSDALLISEHTDGLALIVSIGKVNRDYPKESVRLIKTSNTNLLGLVSNSFIKSSNNRDSYYGYETYENYADDADEYPKKEDDQIGSNKFSRLVEFFKKVYSKISNKSRILINWLDDK
tara:strand:- start:1611 stop:3944 length:2334 start_codon:yes stop_codon:yes gene_type:complete